MKVCKELALESILLVNMLKCRINRAEFVQGECAPHFIFLDRKALSFQDV